MKRLNIDLETFSDVDLFKHGVYRYVDSPNFEILICAYAIDGGEVVSIDMTQEELPDEFLKALEDPNVLKPAYNAQFERVCFGKYIGHNLDPAQWRCTMVHAAQLGLSGSLDAVSKYLGLDETKDAAGKALIRFFSFPCKPTKANGMRTRNYPKDDPEKWQQFIEYCEQDVRAEMAIGDELEAYPVKDSEWELYALDQRINDRGVLTDNALVEGAVQIMEDYSADINGKMKDLMGIDNPNSLVQFKAWLTEQGYDFPGLGKELVKEALKNGDVTGKAKTALEMRLNASISSVKKYQLMHDIECEDERIHGLLQFYGAGRTGRWAGRLVQVQNLPRNYLEDLDTARTLVKAKDWELLQLCYESVPDTVKQLIRTALIAKEGHTFYVSDFSAIEARVIAWYAGEQWRLDVFDGHGMIYEASASQMFHIPIEDVDKELRQKGKVSELALGYQGGPGALVVMGAIKMGVPEEELQGLVDAWRKASPNIVNLWSDVQEAAFEAVESRKVVKLEKQRLVFFMKAGTLFIKLPSGRNLAYPNAKLERGKFGMVIKYDGKGEKVGFVRLETYGGKLVENIVQATARDILGDALIRLDKVGFEIVFHVHDEIVAEVPKDSHYSIEDMNEIMGQSVDWAPGLPLRSDGYTTDYYKKD